jgi:hypothetical protein
VLASLPSGRVTEESGPTPTPESDAIPTPEHTDQSTPEHAGQSTCLVCDEPAVDAPLCSAACAAEAALEREKLVVRLRMLERGGARDLVGDLQLRTAELTAAVLGWRPTVSR